MQVNVGGLRVTAAGEAQQAGRLGQTIPVQNVDSKKTLSARVVGPGAVEIDLGGSR
jgi:flagella basal body P-ring formation protein FlgA